MELKEIERLCRANLWGKFPYPELRKIRALLSEDERGRIEGLNPDLDHYLAYIAGYATSATRLMNRPVADLRQALPILDKGFYDMFPAYSFLQNRITEANTPNLFRHIQAADVLRKELAALIRRNLPD